ncbi:MAG: hypothetical protein CM1200mP22_11270 [Dehalococcoidia bacterium]|nr:MAG: hypothetical protein CM1200mP22_11270 [Dehalococcoidia bacterium]
MVSPVTSHADIKYSTLLKGWQILMANHNYHPNRIVLLLPIGAVLDRTGLLKEGHTYQTTLLMA